MFVYVAKYVDNNLKFGVKGYDNQIKIGRTNDLRERELSLNQTIGPIYVKILHAWRVEDSHEIEKSLHHIHSSLNSIGEWFLSEDNSLIETIDSYLTSLGYSQIPREELNSMLGGAKEELLSKYIFKEKETDNFMEYLAEKYNNGLPLSKIKFDKSIHKNTSNTIYQAEKVQIHVITSSKNHGFQSIKLYNIEKLEDTDLIFFVFAYHDIWYGMTKKELMDFIKEKDIEWDIFDDSGTKEPYKRLLVFMHTKNLKIKSHDNCVPLSFLNRTFKV